MRRSWQGFQPCSNPKLTFFVCFRNLKIIKLNSSKRGWFWDIIVSFYGLEGSWSACVHTATQFTTPLELSGTFSIMSDMQGDSTRTACKIPCERIRACRTAGRNREALWEPADEGSGASEYFLSLECVAWGGVCAWWCHCRSIEPVSFSLCHNPSLSGIKASVSWNF